MDATTQGPAEATSVPTLAPKHDAAVAVDAFPADEDAGEDADVADGEGDAGDAEEDARLPFRHHHQEMLPRRRRCEAEGHRETAHSAGGEMPAGAGA